MLENTHEIADAFKKFITWMKKKRFDRSANQKIEKIKEKKKSSTQLCEGANNEDNECSPLEPHDCLHPVFH